MLKSTLEDVLLWTVKILLIKHLFQLEMDWEDDAFLDEDFPEVLEEEEEETEVAQFNSTASNFTYEVDLNSGSTIMLSYSSIDFTCIFPFFHVFLLQKMTSISMSMKEILKIIHS